MGTKVYEKLTLEQFEDEVCKEYNKFCVSSNAFKVVGVAFKKCKISIDNSDNMRKEIVFVNANADVKFSVNYNDSIEILKENYGIYHLRASRDIADITMVLSSIEVEI